jgi:hypothetical protein
LDGRPRGEPERDARDGRHHRDGDRDAEDTQDYTTRPSRSETANDAAESQLNDPDRADDPTAIADHRITPSTDHSLPLIR